jgi:hypothetical protein
MPTDYNLTLSAELLQLVVMLALVPSSPAISYFISMTFNPLAFLRKERRLRAHSEHIGHTVLGHPNESSVMQIIKFGGSRAGLSYPDISSDVLWYHSIKIRRVQTLAGLVDSLDTT